MFNHLRLTRYFLSILGFKMAFIVCSGAEFVRKEIPLYVLPALSLINLDSPLSSYTDLQHVLFEEEQNAYNQAILQNMR